MIHVSGADNTYVYLVPIYLSKLNFSKFGGVLDKIKLSNYNFLTSLEKSKTVEHLTIYNHHYSRIRPL